MTSLWSKVRGGLDLAKVCLTGIELIHQLIKNKKGGPEATLNLVGKVIARVREALDGSRSPEDIMAELDKMTADLKSNDAAVDDAVDDKFDTD